MTTTRSKFSSLSESGFIPTIFKAITERIQKAVVLISFREWLHSYIIKLIHGVFDRLGVLISFREWLHSYLNAVVKAIATAAVVLISFREWLHSYPVS